MYFSRFFSYYFFLPLLTILFSSCPSPFTTPQSIIDSKHPLFRYTSANYLNPSTQRLQIHLFYEPGAAPEISTPPEEDCWDFLRKGITQLTQSQGKGATLSIGGKDPSSFIQLSHFNQLNEQHKSEWKPSDIYLLAAEQEALFPNNNPLAPAFYLFYLKGYLLSERGKPLPSVLALSLSITSKSKEGIVVKPTPIIAIFKDMIRQNSSFFELPPHLQARYEQITIAHEMGHSLGLVNMSAGIPMKNPHEDPNHPHHCKHKSCLMFWENESFTLLNPLNPLKYTFCKDCIDDVNHFRSSLGN